MLCKSAKCRIKSMLKLLSVCDIKCDLLYDFFSLILFDFFFLFDTFYLLDSFFSYEIMPPSPTSRIIRGKQKEKKDKWIF